MKISVIVSIYNGKQYITEQMDSIRTQTRSADEVLFFDDCSSDYTVEIVEDYIKKYKLNGWFITANERNKGWKKNFMDGLWQASGDLIFPCDQDDIWMRDKLKNMEKIMLEHSEVNVLTTNCQAFYDSGKVIVRPEPENHELIKQAMVQNIFETKYPGCTYCIRKEFVELSKLYWEDDFPHDALFWRMGMFSGTLYSYNESLVRWRRHEDSTYTIESVQLKTAANKREWIDYGIRVVNSLCRFTETANCPDKQKADQILDTTMRWLKLRADFYDSKKIIKGIQLLKYRKCYDRVKQYIGDIYLVYMSEE